MDNTTQLAAALLEKARSRRRLPRPSRPTIAYRERVARVVNFWLSDESYWRAHSLIWVCFAIVVAYWSIRWSVLLLGLAGLEYGFWLIHRKRRRRGV
jgi:hypothetical protein